MHKILKSFQFQVKICPFTFFGGMRGWSRGDCTATQNLRRHDDCLLHRESCSCARVCLFLACAKKHTQTPLHLQKEGTVIDFVAECLKLPFPWKQREPYHNTPNRCGWTGTKPSECFCSAAQRRALRVHCAGFFPYISFKYHRRQSARKYVSGQAENQHGLFSCD